MNWNSNERDRDENEMFPMSSSRMREEDVRTRLLSVSGDEDDLEEGLARNLAVPELSFRNEGKPAVKRSDERKSRRAVLTILVVGLGLILAVNIGVAMRMRQKEQGAMFISNFSTCLEKHEPPAVKCDKSFPWQQYRLPKIVRPELYSIFLWPNLTTGIFNGSINISVYVTSPANKIILHAKFLNLSDISVKRDGSSEVKQRSVVYCKELNFVAINFNEKLIPGEKYKIHIKFIGSMQGSQSLRGFYLSKYHTSSGKTMKLGTTQFESISARRAFPCFDEPNFKANFSISIVREEAFKTLSNMPVVKTTKFFSGLELDDFQTTVSMSTYLVAFIVSRFVGITKTIPSLNGQLNVSVYARQDQISNAEFALNVSCQVIQFYENLFKIPYPLPKLDLVAIPDFEAGAMENWGLVTYRETAVLWNNESSSITDQEYVALVIAHEFAHQWFGNLVTMDWWNDLWLNEGFASFMEYYSVDKLFPKWHYMDGFFEYHTSTAMITDESEYSHPISVHVDSAVQIEEIFDSISYSKGSCLIMMMIDYLGEKAFMDGVSDYLKKFSYRNTQNMDLVKAVAAKANPDVQKTDVPNMLTSWTTQPGFPVVNVSLDGNTVRISQTRFLSRKADDKNEKCSKPHKDLLWQIPLSYSTSLSKSGSKRWYYFENKTDEFVVEGTPEWIILNVNRGGYYLVNYDEKLMTSLTQQLKKNHSVFTPTDRAGILFNAVKMAKTGRMSYAKLFDLISYTKNEEDLHALQLAGDILFSVVGKLKRQFNKDALSKMNKFTKDLLGSLYMRYGWPKINETKFSLSHPEIKLRKYAVSLMCGVEDDNCTQEALKRFHLWKDKNVAVHPEYKSMVYNIGIRQGTNETWHFCWKKYTTDKTIDATEKRKILAALASSTHQEHVLLLLDELMKNGNIRSQDADSVLSYLSSTKIGSLLSWKFLRNKWADLMNMFPLGSSASQRFLNIFYSFTDDADIAAAEEFIAERNLTNFRFVKRALDHAKFNVHWIKTIQPQIIQWLNEYSSASH